MDNMSGSSVNGLRTSNGEVIDPGLSFLTEKNTRRVSLGQLEELWEFLNTNRGLTTGANKSAESRYKSSKLWAQIASSLNTRVLGAQKDGRGWQKYWNDYKCKIKKFSSQLSSPQTTSEGTSIERPLTDIEQKFLQLINLSTNRKPKVAVDPLKGGIPENSNGYSIDPLDDSNELSSHSIHRAIEPSRASHMSPDPRSVPSSLTSSPLIRVPRPLISSPSHTRPTRRQTEGHSATRRQLFKLRERRVTNDELLLKIMEKRSATDDRMVIALEQILVEVREMNNKLRNCFGPIGVKLLERRAVNEERQTRIMERRAVTEERMAGTLEQILVEQRETKDMLRFSARTRDDE